MVKFLKRRRLHIWIACFAILLNALAPSISHALTARTGSSQLMEVCTADGIKYVALDGSGPVQSPVDVMLHHLEHCPYCMSDAGAPPLPSAMVTPFAVSGGHDLFPELFYSSPSPLFTWSQAHPRAPPARA